ncbi:MAG: Mut7-C ubiquitin/RNAse domain-containing protein [Desulfobacterales bacterium]|nr:Mut7-C ubiquitin/RNAse domain-containing protein [Desulfobacterales bacterium]
MVDRVFENTACFRFYEELNDFLPPDKRKKTFDYPFNGNPSIKDPIEALGVPHTEVDLIIANGRSVGFDYKLINADMVSVYPVFESIDISPIVKLREKPLRKSAFIVDSHLGKLVRLLRLLGLDTRYSDDEDTKIIRLAIHEKRIILTRDRQLLQRKEVTHGYCIRSTNPELQLKEVLKRFDLYSQIKEFYRCTMCNGVISPINKSDIRHRLGPKTDKYFNEFYFCPGCERIYWKGSHYKKLKKKIEMFR